MSLIVQLYPGTLRWSGLYDTEQDVPVIYPNAKPPVFYGTKPAVMNSKCNKTANPDAMRICECHETGENGGTRALLFGNFYNRKVITLFDPANISNPFLNIPAKSEFDHWQMVGGNFDDKVYFLGDTSSYIEVFDLLSWSILQNERILITRKRHGHIGGIVNEKFIICGGKLNGVPSSTCDTYNLNEQNWTQNDLIMNESRYYACSIVTKEGKLFVFGPGNTAEVYSTETNFFSVLPDMPNQHEQCYGVEFDNNLFVCGHQSSKTFEGGNKCDVFLCSTSAWQSEPTYLKNGRRALGTVVLRNEMYALFGASIENRVTTVEKWKNDSFYLLGNYSNFAHAHFLTMPV